MFKSSPLPKLKNFETPTPCSPRHRHQCTADTAPLWEITAIEPFGGPRLKRRQEVRVRVDNARAVRFRTKRMP